MRSNHFKINAARVSHETIDGEILIIHHDTGNYYSLLGAGADVWSLVQRRAAVADIVDVIHHQYDSARVEVEKAIDEFLAELQEEELIVHDDGEGPGSAAGTADRVEPEGSKRSRTFEAPVLTKYTDMRDLLVLDPIHEVDESGWPTPAEE